MGVTQMRKYDKEDKHDQQELKELKVEDWMVDLVNRNPTYPWWGNHEDYMMGGKGWAQPTEFATWEEFGPWELDCMNEVVNFYFQLARENVECDVRYQFPGYRQTETCGGLNHETRQLDLDWYDFHDTGRRWSENITQDEFDALKEGGRLWDYDNVEEVNRKSSGRHMVHDAINRWICVATRAKRLGVYGKCKKCEGNGYLYTADQGHLELQLWFLLPRKGCSKGVLIKNIDVSEIEEVKEYLQLAAKRNAERFDLTIK